MADDDMSRALYHFSECGTIGRFAPRPVASDPASEPLVWAVDREHAVNYFLPRDCPRVCFARGPGSLAEDVERFLPHSGARRVVAVESGWIGKIASTRLFRYTLPAAPFRCLDAGAGYWVAREPVMPLAIETLDDLPGAIAGEGIELRILPSLWPLHDAVAASTLEFSMIRMRNAAPREAT
jgi:hypothetical protein